MLEVLRNLADIVSLLAIPLFLVGIPLYGVIKGVKVYEAFVEGAKEGFGIAVMIIPYLVAILIAIGMFRASGGLDALADLLRTPLSLLGIHPELLPMMIVRPLTGGGSIGVLGQMAEEFGSDSILTKTAAVMFGSTETTFYVIAVYFGAVGIRKTRHAVAAGLIADGAAMLLAVWVVALVIGGASGDVPPPVNP
ncbi:MAG: nucleoside recognition domain-containing protein [Planctomycetota bacterium]